MSDDNPLLSIRPLWRRAFWLPKVFWGHYRIHRRVGNGVVQSVRVAFLLSRMLLRMDSRIRGNDRVLDEI